MRGGRRRLRACAHSSTEHILLVTLHSARLKHAATRTCRTDIPAAPPENPSSPALYESGRIVVSIARAGPASADLRLPPGPVSRQEPTPLYVGQFADPECPAWP